MARYRDASWLHEQYHDEGKTQREIAEECGVSPSAIRKWMRRHGIETREVTGENHGLYGEERDEDVKAKISETLEGREFDETWRERLADARRGRTVEEETRRKISESLEGQAKSESTRQRMSEATRGERNPNWRGGYSERYGPGWAFAREHVRERDQVCQHCGHDGRTRRLEVHHIIQYGSFEKRQASHLQRRTTLRTSCFSVGAAIRKQTTESLGSLQESRTQGVRTGHRGGTKGSVYNGPSPRTRCARLV